MISRGGNRLSLGDQESVRRNAKGGVMVEAAPTPSFKMSQPDLLLEFLIVAFDPPSQLGNVDELTERDVLRKRRQPIFDRLLLAIGPFNQQPLRPRSRRPSEPPRAVARPRTPNGSVPARSRAWFETDLVRNSYLAPTCAVARPLLRQIQPIGHRQAGIMIGDRQRHRDLTIVLLAKLAAILSSHPDRMLPFLGKARVVDDPRFDRPVAFQLWQHQFPHLRENLLVRPSSLADKMQQRLMLGCGPFWRRDRCHRLHAFALARHHQTQAIIAKRLG